MDNQLVLVPLRIESETERRQSTHQISMNPCDTTTEYTGKTRANKGSLITPYELSAPAMLLLKLATVTLYHYRNNFEIETHCKPRARGTNLVSEKEKQTGEQK